MKKNLFLLCVLLGLSSLIFSMGGFPEMILVEKGSFLMGNSRLRLASDTITFPLREVTITYDFYIGKYEITFEEYDLFCEETGREKARGEKRGRYPVFYITFMDCIDYCNWLSEKSGFQKPYDAEGNLINGNGEKTNDISEVQGFRLPTEAEWEYAARGGIFWEDDFVYAGGNSVNDYVWYLSNSNNKDNDLFEGKGPQIVGTKLPNQLGIYDMNGNVWERCYDWYKEDITDTGDVDPINLTENESEQRALRGGSWASCLDGTKVAKRCKYILNRGSDILGLRVVRKK